MTITVGVLVRSQVADPAPPRPQVAHAPRARPHLTNTDDVRATALHRVHLTATPRLECAACHDVGANDFRAPPVATCLQCHADHPPAIHRGAVDATACLTCHDFLVPVANHWAETCARCHVEPQNSRPAIVVHLEEDCTQCHAVHGKPVTPPCLTCHARQETGHPAGGTAPATCTSCHAPHVPARAAK
ncbi:MAG: cytochrome c3 family protein, partial [Proteobacteria bacterium]|nr:cytochrome c3 family protein [Pseudomonadota bacterium]